MKKLIIIIVLLIFFLGFTIDGSAFERIERRKKQFLTEQSYLIFPLPYSLNGIGSGVVVTALAGNIGGTNIDAYALGITGDAQGSQISVGDIHILPETLILEINRQDINAAVVNFYEKRGMNTKKDDYKLMEVDKADSLNTRLTYSLFDRRLEVYGAYERSEFRLIKILSSKGDLISDMRNNPYVSENKTTFVGAVFDYTDDRQDPRKGIRFEVTRKESPSQGDVNPEFFVIDKSLSIYLPLGNDGTLAFNYFASDANMISKGDVNPANIRNEVGMNCPPLDDQCLKAEQELVDLFINERSNGTATALGGQNRLRSYAGNRYNGAHSLYYATELRWNFVKELKPFDYWIWKDVATGIQFALFYETGSVAETNSQLGDIWRSSYGLGFRLISASGFVYRADIASGDEGIAPTMIFSYPW